MKNVIHVFNARVSLVSPIRFAGQEKIKEILGLTEIPDSIKPLLRQPVMPDKFLTGLETIKGQVRSAMLGMATRDEFFGWIIDPDKKSQLMQTMSDLKAKFYVEKDTVLKNAPQAYQTHLKALEEKCIKDGLTNYHAYIDAVRNAQPSVYYLSTNLQFNYLQPRAIELREDEVEIIRQGVFGQALYEISQRADKASDIGYITAKLRAADEIIAKLKGLSYIEPKFSLIANQMSSLIIQIPRGIKNEEYDTMHALALNGMFQILADDHQVIKSLAASEPLFHQKTATPALPLPEPVVAVAKVEQPKPEAVVADSQAGGAQSFSVVMPAQVIKPVQQPAIVTRKVSHAW